MEYCYYFIACNSIFPCTGSQVIIRTYLDYPIEVVARKLKVRPNTISKARRKIARELRKKLV